MGQKTDMTRAWIVIAVTLLFPSAAAWGHPHGWIDVQSKVVFDDAGRITAIEQAWLFDELYSAFMLDEFATSGQTRDEGLAQLAHEDIAALAPFDYFTRVEVEGEAQPFVAVTDYANGVAAERIWLRFRLPLAEAIDPAADMRYAVYDPTYYIELLHIGAAPVQLEGTGSEGCTTTVVEPTPSTEIVGLAAALDQFAVADEGLGTHFAQWIELRCAPS